MNEPRVVATVLNWANPWGTREVLRCLAAQTRPVDAVVVVDNGSPDPFEHDGEGLKALDIVRSATNVGVGGGHNLGVTTALGAHAADFVWVLEHDTFPDSTCLAELLRASASAGEPCVVATELSRNNYERVDIPDADGTRVAKVTLNGPLVPRHVFETVGLLNEALFVGQEDWEFSNRLSAAGVTIVRATSAVALHANKGMGRFDGYVSPTRLYYSARNLVALAERAKSLRATRLLAAAAVELVRPGRGPVFAAARFWAAIDGLLGRLGQRSYRFMRS